MVFEWFKSEIDESYILDLKKNQQTVCGKHDCSSILNSYKM